MVLRFVLAKSWQACADSGVVVSIVGDICRCVVDSCCNALLAWRGESRDRASSLKDVEAGLVGAVLPELVVGLCALLASYPASARGLAYDVQLWLPGLLKALDTAVSFVPEAARHVPGNVLEHVTVKENFETSHPITSAWADRMIDITVPNAVSLKLSFDSSSALASGDQLRCGAAREL